MDKATISAAVAATFFISGSVYSTSTHSLHSIYHSDFALTSSDALVLMPVENQEYADAADNLYLEPNGFDGAATNFSVPETPNEVASVGPGVQDLVEAVESQYTAGDFGATDPLYIFGYSQGAVEASLAEQQLANFGIPENALHFVMIGDSASAEGGFLNTLVDSLPESLRPFATDIFTLLNAGSALSILGATTPDNLYPTDVYTLSGDGWANWDDGQNLLGMYTDHLEYLGLTPAEIESATLSTDGLTDYYTIDSADVNGLSAYWNQLMLGLSVPTTTDTADAVLTQAAASTTTTDNADDVFTQAAADLTQATPVLDSAPTASLDAENLSILNSEQSLITGLEPTLTQQASLQDSLPAADQTSPLLADADEHFLQAYNGLLSADQAFVAADQAGDLTGQASSLSAALTQLSVDHGLIIAELGLAPANFDVDFADIVVAIADDFGLYF
jgi:hypothetical protein